MSKGEVTKVVQEAPVMVVAGPKAVAKEVVSEVGLKVAAEEVMKKDGRTV